MPSKAYLKEQREEMSIRLLAAGLALNSIQGIKNVGLMDMLNKVIDHLDLTLGHIKIR